MRRIRLFYVLAVSAIGLLTIAAHAQAPQADYFTNTELIDQDSRKLRFYDDVLKGKVVVINSFYVTCTGACPHVTKKMTEVQNAFPANFGKNLFFISITVDPETDTPEKLRAFATKYGAKPGRRFLTGTKENVTVVLKKLGQYTEDKSAHPTIIFIGNDKTGLWKKASSLQFEKELIEIIESVLADKP